MLGSLNCTTQTRVCVYHANILEEVVRFTPTCPEAVQFYPCSTAEGVAWGLVDGVWMY